MEENTSISPTRQLFMLHRKGIFSQSQRTYYESYFINRPPHNVLARSQIKHNFLTQGIWFTERSLCLFVFLISDSESSG